MDGHRAPEEEEGPDDFSVAGCADEQAVRLRARRRWTELQRTSGPAFAVSWKTSSKTGLLSPMSSPEVALRATTNNDTGTSPGGTIRDAVSAITTSRPLVICCNTERAPFISNGSGPEPISGEEFAGRLSSLIGRFLWVGKVSWDFMTSEEQDEFLSENGHLSARTISDALSFVKKTRSWRFWIFPCKKLPDTDSLLRHMCSKHPAEKDLPKKLVAEILEEKCKERTVILETIKQKLKNLPTQMLSAESLCNLKNFRDKLLTEALKWNPYSENPCIADILCGIFFAWERYEPYPVFDILTSVKNILCRLADDNSIYEKVGESFASKTVITILIELHMLETSLSFSSTSESERKVVHPITCGDCIWPTHGLFRINFDAEMSCSCGMCSDNYLYTTIFHILDAGSPQTTKIKSFAELQYILDDQFFVGSTCPHGTIENVGLFLSNTPHCFTVVLNWASGSECQDTLSEVFAGITSPVDAEFFCRSSHSATKYIVASMVGESFASKSVITILIELHMFETSLSFSYNTESERKVVNPITCGDCIWPTHSLFGINFDAQMSCSCGKCSDNYLHTTISNILDAVSPQTTKIKSFAELQFILDDQFSVGNTCKHCGTIENVGLFLSNTPHCFTIVLNWASGTESQDTLSDVLAGITCPRNAEFFCRSSHATTNYIVSSMICHADERYVCFARDEGNWLLYDSETVETIDTWEHLLESFKDCKLQPEVLFFEVIK